MCNAAGGNAPPLTIYKGKHISDQWHAPSENGFGGTVYAASENVWKYVKTTFSRPLSKQWALSDLC